MNKTVKVTIMVGTRPQIIKSVPLIREMEKQRLDYEVIHTGQHYSYALSENFFRSFKLPHAKCNLNVGSGTRHEQLGGIITQLGKYAHEVEFALIPGDTNSALACALTCFINTIPIGHVEAGARSFDMSMPEETNRLVIDRISQHLFTSTEISLQNLINERIQTNIFNVGDVMLDLLLQSLPFGTEILNKLKVKSDEYSVLTLHRPFNVDSASRLNEIINELEKSGERYIFPAHHRVPELTSENVSVIEPLNYYDFLSLVSHSKFVVTDSGGLQKEAYWLKKQCFTVRPNTEWTETLSSNILVEPSELSEQIMKNRYEEFEPNFRAFGNGAASEKIVKYIKELTDTDT